MMGRSHLILAGTAYAALVVRPLDTPVGVLNAPVLSGLPADPRSELLLSLVVAAACGLAPDIDKAGSTASRSLGIPTRVLSWGIERSFGHRGGFHSLLAAALAYVLGDLLGGLLGLTGLGALVAFGWVVHLLTDAWTVHGVPLFWPMSAARVRLPPWISTGSVMEAVVLVLTVGLLTAYAVGSRPSWDGGVGLGSPPDAPAPASAAAHQKADGPMPRMTGQTSSPTRPAAVTRIGS